MLIAGSYQTAKSCAWYDPDYEYFNLFTQTLIKNKSLTPFLLSYSTPYYGDQTSAGTDENVRLWQQYFNHTLTAEQTAELVYKTSLQDLNLLKKGNPEQPLLQTLGIGFYAKYKEGLDYLIEAKYVAPYMLISGASTDDFYGEETKTLTAADLNYPKTMAALQSLYQAAQDPTIKLRYAFQMVRFQHYNRKYQEAILDFKKYVAPLGIKNEVYYMALQQMAGAQRGLDQVNEANWNFFQVFLHSKDLKIPSYTSMRLSSEYNFQDLINRSQNNNEKAMAYFILGYQDYSNPLPMMEKIYVLQPQSELLKVLAARAINELERSYLPISYYGTDQNTITDISTNSKTDTTTSENSALSFWQKIVNFFKRLFGKEEKKETKTTETQYNVSNRIPFLDPSSNLSGNQTSQEIQLQALENFVAKLSKEKDDFWKLAAAYLKFLNKKYDESNTILSGIKSQDPEYQAEIKKMKILNEIVGQTEITEDFEKHLIADYKTIFLPEKKKTENPEDQEVYGIDLPTTEGFLRDILANRYFLQNEKAKSFLMNNDLTDFRINPDENLAKALDAFYQKDAKNDFEKEVLLPRMQSVGDIPSYFNVLYGDFAMKKADFDKALDYYTQATHFSGYPLPNERYDYSTGEDVPLNNTADLYNGFKNISNLVFGHNKWESFGSAPQDTMIPESFLHQFNFIPSNMDKAQLVSILLKLKKIAEGSDEKAGQANQLIGNVLYNTSALGYFRELFVADINNGDGGKYNFGYEPSTYQYYYKNYSYTSAGPSENFDYCLKYYQQALQKIENKEQKARILFQMASAEQGKFYQYQATHPFNFDYNDPNYEAKEKKYNTEMEKIQKEKYKTYFSQLKDQYAQTQTAQNLRGSCSYFNYFMKH